MIDSRRPESKLLLFISTHVTKLCILCYTLGLAGFLVLPYRDISENHYHSENALLTGLQTPNYGTKEQRAADLINQEFLRIRESTNRDVFDSLASHMRDYGMTAYKQEFSFKHPLPAMQNQNLYHTIKNGTNVYGFIRTGRAASTESIVLNIPINEDRHNYAVGFALSIGRQIRAQPFWAKDIVLLFSYMGYVGSQAWLQSYYDMKSDYVKGSPLQERAGAILASLNLDFPDAMSLINVEVVGNKGQLPNLDLVNVVWKLSYQNSVKMAVGGVYHKNSASPERNYKDSLKMVSRMFLKQASGFTEFNHATFLQHNIQSLTIQGVKSEDYRQTEAYRVGRIVEGTVRSLNNLLEKLHHSYFFYLISATDRFISIVLYMPPLGLILLAPALKALSLWMDRKKASKEKEDEETIDEVGEFIRRSLKSNNQEPNNPSPWMGVFYRIALAELLGVLLYFSPFFASAWSAMYAMDTARSLILIFFSTYASTLVLPFNILVRPLDDRKAFDDLHSLLRIIALLLFCVIIGCTAVLNFSLAMITAALTVPLLTPISSDSKRFKLMKVGICLLASPVVVTLVVFYAADIFFNGDYDTLWNVASTKLLKSYEQSLLGNSWNYEFACLLIHPIWMLFWILAVAKAPEKEY